MSTGHSIIPVDAELLSHVSNDWMVGDLVFVSNTLPYGRFPTLNELRYVIHELDYTLEEERDWSVASEDDHTDIWFTDEAKSEDGPVEFWFQGGGLIVLDIMQNIANQFGSFVVADHSGFVNVVVPDSVFPALSLSVQDKTGFAATISRRLPVMINGLNNATLEDTWFLLSQIRQPLKYLDFFRNYELLQSAQQGLPVYTKLLEHTDEKVRYMAFDLVATFRDRLYQNAEVLSLAIQNEVSPDTKSRMIWVTERLITSRRSYDGRIDHPARALLDIFEVLTRTTAEPLSVRIAAANTLIRAQPGFLTSTIQMMFTDLLIQPERYIASWNKAYSVIQQTLKTIENLLLHHRIEILSSALPQITYAQDAHDVLRNLLDNVFFGGVHHTGMSSPLPDDRAAERPERDETRFREHLSRDLLYPANPTRITIEELLPFQREVLEVVIDLDIPWMVHSNLLEKYGLPPTRQAVRDLLASSK